MATVPRPETMAALPETSVVLLPQMVAVEAVEVAREVASVVEIGTETTAGEPEDGIWFGGREGYLVYEDDWVAGRSWTFTSRVCESTEYGLHAYVKLRIHGTSKGRCVPQKAVAWLAFGYDKDDWTKPKIELGSRNLRSLKTAKRWAKSLITLAALRLLYQQFYSTSELSHEKRGTLIERFDKELGWHPWFWSFDHYFNELLPLGDYRTTDREGHVYLIRRHYGWVHSSWPSCWDRISQRGEGWGTKRLHDEFGAL